MEENKIYCSHCGVLIEDEDFDTVNGEPACTDCLEHHTTTCDRCGATIWESDAYGDEYINLCRHFYENHYTRYSFGVELEIDGVSKDSDNADDLLEITNVSEEHIYIKSDGSLDDGMEIVSHPMTLDYHKNFFGKIL